MITRDDRRYDDGEYQSTNKEDRKIEDTTKESPEDDELEVPAFIRRKLR
jgi:hypothetical protein